MKYNRIVSISALLAASLLRTQAATIAGWTFDNIPVAAPTLNPTPSVNNSLGTISVAALGMNVYPTTGIGTTAPDVALGKSSDTGANGIADLTQYWRVRATGAGNGWSSQAPIGTQGAQFNVPTTGFQSISVQFDWYLTTQGEANLQLQYTIDGVNWINVPITIPTGSGSGNAGLANVDNTSGADSQSVQGYYISDNVLNNGPMAGQDWFTNLTATISDPSAPNNPNFAIRLVNASTGASCVSSQGTALNNSSGNWRFDNIYIYGTGGGSTLLTPPTISPAVAATVDAPFTETFTDSFTWRAAITNLTVNGYALPSAAYAISAGQIKFTPAASTNLQTAGTLNISVRAAGYLPDTVSQVLSPGAGKLLKLTQQPVAPTGNGGTLVTQPMLEYLDQYGNVATNVNATLTATVGSGTWTFGPGSAMVQVVTNGTATFTNLSATSTAAVTGATIVFNATGTGIPSPSTITSVAFNIPAPLTSGFTPGNLAVLQEDVAAKNSTFSILELNPNVPNQNAPVNTYPVSATGTNALRQSSAATTGRLADSNDGTLVCFTGFEDGSSATADETTIDPRGVGTLNGAGTFNLATSYIGLGDATGNQTRSASTVDNTNYTIGDKGGVYVNGGTSPLIAGAGNNVRSVKAFGGTVYALQQASSSVINTPISIVSGATLYPLDGFSQDTAVLDFYMIQSGANGTNFDTVYYIDGTNSNAGGIYKYYLTQNFDPNTGQQLWQFAGTMQTTNGGDGLCAATNAAGGVDLYYTTGSGGIAGNSLIKVHDSAPDNTTINLGTPVTLFTVSSNATLKGVTFAPVATVASLTGTPSLPFSIAAGSLQHSGTAASFGFTNASSVSFTVWGTTNLTLPLAQWQNLGHPLEGPAGNYRFADATATNAAKYYRLSQP